MAKTGIAAVSTADPAKIIQMMTVDTRARVLVSGVQVGVFTELGRGAATGSELAARLGLHPRLCQDFFDALAALELIEREGDRYRNTPLAACYLDAARPAYIGAFVEQIPGSLSHAWDQLRAALRTGMAPGQEPDKGGFAEGEHRDPQRVRHWLSGQDAMTDRIGEEIADLLDWSRFSIFADLGGARGNLASVLVRRYPRLRGICVDRPRTRPFFDEYMASRGSGDRVRFQEADLLIDPLPEVDVAIYGQVLHGVGVAARKTMIERAFRAVRPGGLLLAYDRMIDDDRSDAYRLLASLHTMLVTPAGSEYRSADCMEWLQEAGFRDVSVSPLLSSHTLVIGYRQE